MKKNKSLAYDLLIKGKYKEILLPFTIIFSLLTILIMGDKITSLNSMNAFALSIPLILLAIFIGELICKGTYDLYLNYKEDVMYDKDIKNKVLFQGMILVLISSIVLAFLMYITKNIYTNLFNVTDLTLVKYSHVVNNLIMIVSIIPVVIYMSMLCKINKYKNTKYQAIIISLFLLLISSNILSSYKEQGIGMILLSALILQIVMMSIKLSKKNNESILIINKEFNYSKQILKFGIKETYKYGLDFLFILVTFILSSYTLGEDGLFVMLHIDILLLAGRLFESLHDNFKNQIYLYRTEYNYEGVKLTFKENLKILLTDLLIMFVLIIVVSLFMNSSNTYFITDGFTYNDQMTKLIPFIGLVIIINNVTEMFIAYYKVIGKYKLAYSILTLERFIYPIFFMYNILIDNANIENICLSFFMGSLCSVITLFVVAKIVQTKDKNLSYPLLLDTSKSDIIYYNILLDDVKNIVKVKDEVFDLLKEKDIDSKKRNIVCLLIEDLLVLIKEKNIDNKKCTVLSEVTVMLRKDNSIRIVFKDNGGDINITDTDSNIGSLRQYIVNELLINKVRKERVAGIEFNRNIVEFR